MRALAPLARSLDRVLVVALARRFFAWLATALIVLALGAALGTLVGRERIVQLAALMIVFSALPAFLLWPPPAGALWSRLRWLDEESVFESYLEAPPGPSRLLLRDLAASKAAALPFRKPPRENPLRGLAPLLLVAGLTLCVVESASLLLQGHGLSLMPTRPAVRSEATRIEDSGFSDFATEDPAARRQRRELALDSEQTRRGLEGAGSPATEGKTELPASRRPRSGAEGAGDFSSLPQESAPASGPGAQPAAGSEQQSSEHQGGATPAGGSRAAGTRPATSPAGGGEPLSPEGEESPGGGKTSPKPSSALAGKGGQGYDRTGNTGVASPLLDYRSRFASVYAQRTGKQMTAGDRLDLGELRDFQRRYFGSFELRTDFGLAEDPYAALLKRRWDELRGGLQ